MKSIFIISVLILAIVACAATTIPRAQAILQSNKDFMKESERIDVGKELRQLQTRGINIANEINSIKATLLSIKQKVKNDTIVFTAEDLSAVQTTIDSIQTLICDAAACL